MKVVIAGATGVVGKSAVEEFLKKQSCEVISISRRTPKDLLTLQNHTHLSLDLLDREKTIKTLSELKNVTNIVYAALYENDNLVEGWIDPNQINNNDDMLRNLVQGVMSSDSEIKHISLLQGTKAYGYHIKPMRVPGKERHERVSHPNFYWKQEDFITDLASKKNISFTIFRPQFIFGDAFGNAMSLIPVIAVYAAIRNELGQKFGFPGGDSYVAEAVDSRLLAKSLIWAAENISAQNQVFNITNGDIFDWRDLWGGFAKSLGVEQGPDESFSLEQWFADKSDIWDSIVKKYSLQINSLSEIIGKSHKYADNAFAYQENKTAANHRTDPVLLSTIKLRSSGFTEFMDTEEMFNYWFKKMRAEKIVP
jgi:nucleoside-diphosphate-sugar epimerase